MRVAVVSIQKHESCTLKDMAGGFGTRFEIGDSPGARLLQYAKKKIANIPDISLAYLNAILCTHKHDVKIFLNEAPDDFDVYLMQSSIVECNSEKKAAGHLHKAGGRRVGFWGSFASAVPEFYLDDCDFVLRGEPEAFDYSSLEKDMAGVVEAGTIADLDELPYPDWKGFPLDQYRYRIIGGGGATLPVYSSRGCPFKCGYCPYKVYNPFRARNIDCVVDEIQYLRSEYNAESIVFRDPDFTFNAERTRELLEKIIETGNNCISYYIEGRTNGIDKKTVELMARAGITGWETGIESPDNELLRKHGRIPPELESQVDIIRHCAGRGIRIVGNYVIGFPEDTKESIENTIKLAKRINSFAVQFTVLTPYPGTEFYEKVRADIYSENFEDFTGWNNVFKHPSLSADDIAAFREKAYVSYHFRIRYFIAFCKILLNSIIASWKRN